jgi:hypothetical protein
MKQERVLTLEGADAMRKSRFREAQIIGMFKEQETGMATAEVCSICGSAGVARPMWRQTRKSCTDPVIGAGLLS